jgi:hypothetical protein
MFSKQDEFSMALSCPAAAIDIGGGFGSGQGVSDNGGPRGVEDDRKSRELIVGAQQQTKTCRSGRESESP